MAISLNYYIVGKWKLGDSLTDTNNNSNEFMYSPSLYSPPTLEFSPNCLSPYNKNPHPHSGVLSKLAELLVSEFDPCIPSPQFPILCYTECQNSCNGVNNHCLPTPKKKTVHELYLFNLLANDYGTYSWFALIGLMVIGISMFLFFNILFLVVFFPSIIC